MIRREFLKALVALTTLPLASLAKLAPKFCTGGIVRGHFHNPEFHPGCYLADVARMPMLEFDCTDKWRDRSYKVDLVVDEKAHRDAFFRALVGNES